MTNQRKQISSTSGYITELALLYCHSLTPCVSIYGSGTADITIQNFVFDGSFSNASIIHSYSVSGKLRSGTTGAPLLFR